MRWIERYRLACHWLDLDDACRHFRGLVSDLYWSVVGLFLVGAWLVASPLLALYGSFRPTQLFKFLQWLRD